MTMPRMVLPQKKKQNRSYNGYILDKILVKSFDVFATWPSKYLGTDR